MPPRHPLLPLLTGALCLLVCCAASSAKRKARPPVDRSVVAINWSANSPVMGAGTPLEVI